MSTTLLLGFMICFLGFLDLSLCEGFVVTEIHCHLSREHKPDNGKGHNDDDVMWENVFITGRGLFSPLR